jgi:hypothetical protein
LGFNHFSPSGVQTDFSADNLVFDQIVKSLNSK